jgi:hypothetical protein
MLALLDGHSKQAKAADGALVATLFNPANAALAQMTAAIPIPARSSARSRP